MKRIKEIDPKSSKNDAFIILKTDGRLSERLDRL